MAVFVPSTDSLHQEGDAQSRFVFGQLTLIALTKMFNIVLHGILHRELMREFGFLAQILERDPLVHALLGFHANLVVLLGVVDELEDAVEAEIATRFWALVWLHLSVSTEVLVQVPTRRESLLAKTALEWSVPGVGSLMYHQIRLVAETLATDLE